ncbi:DUF2785 domain-containing protein [Heyndrickxia camelliae]|uniref:Uncharacterized protein n=1 Tax=Heyndrickxia camelliae TaxID=1707093 RepID=A0A2N3LKC8_9BACI|nr:hypothetical protein CWO92_09840 [Heyndrickxia camelliae]
MPTALKAIHSCLFKNGSYIDDEDERLIFAVEALLDKDISNEMLEGWITSISHTLEKIFKKDRYSLGFYRSRTNIMNFLKTLYFRLEFKEKGNTSRKLIYQIIKNWHDVIYVN